MMTLLVDVMQQSYEKVKYLLAAILTLSEYMFLKTRIGSKLVRKKCSFFDDVLKNINGENCGIVKNVETIEQNSRMT